MTITSKVNVVNRPQTSRYYLCKECGKVYFFYAGGDNKTTCGHGKAPLLEISPAEYLALRFGEPHGDLSD